MANSSRDRTGGRSTTARGLGYEHQQQRRRLLEDLVPGEPCGVCREPMYPEQQLDADHETPRALGGTRAGRLLHQSCNRRRGAQLGNRMRAGGPRPASSSARCWCGGNCFTHVPVGEL